MKMFRHLLTGAGLVALVAGLVVAGRSAQAQAPAAGTARSAVVAPAPRPTAPPVSVTNRAAPRTLAANSNLNPYAAQRRVYTVPSQGVASGAPRRLHYGHFPARREVFTLKPWIPLD